MNVNDIFPLAEAISAALADDIVQLEAGEPCALLEHATPTTSELLRFWFQSDYRETRDVNFHVGQRDAILAIIYAHEVLAAENLLDLYQKLDRQAILEPGRLGELTSPRNQHPKYAAKMATGTGKTWVLNAILVWQHLNSLANPSDPRFTSNFLIVAPGLIVYDRLLDSFLGQRGSDGRRDFSTSDIARHAQLFLPDHYRAGMLAFVAASAVGKYDIGRRSTGAGVIAITNWHRLAGKEDPDFLDDEPEIRAPGADIDAAAAARSFVPLSPGLNAGNSLDVLDRKFNRGEAMRWLKDRPSLLVLNDEAHHVHTSRKGDEESEVEWQRSLNDLASGKGRRFVQIDFSATPYNEWGGKRKWFPHIVVDFDLHAAMSRGLVKTLALDKRQEVAAIPNSELEFRAIRTDDGHMELSSGQRVMLRAGLERLRILEEQFAKQDASKRPKLLVMVEDTKVSPLVEEFLLSEGYAAKDILRVDSGRKAELGQREWELVRDRLFDLDAHAQPKIVISVLMLREGFDVNNICVIVPLRSAESGILAEQTVGRGLRLMWRHEPEIEAQKSENRARILRRQAPTSYFDVLFLVEHPRFEALYEELLGQGLVGEIEDGDRTPATGDAERVELRDGFERYDFAVPFVLRDVEEELDTPRIDVTTLPLSTIPLGDLIKVVPAGDRFMAEDYATKTRFGPFTIEGAKLGSRGYNEYLGKLVNRITGAIGRSFTEKGTLKQNPGTETLLQVQRPLVVAWANQYIRTRFFGVPFDPLAGEQWRVLMIDDIADQITRNLARALVESLREVPTGEPDVVYRRVSEVESITVRASSCVEVAKCIYPRLPIPSRAGGLERTFIEWADSDSSVEALVKIHEYKHSFLRRPYLKEDGMPAQYSPDFLVRTTDAVYVVETKAQSSLSDANVRRKQRAAVQWVSQLNALPPEYRAQREWRYVLLGEKIIHDWKAKGMTATALLAYAQLRVDSREEPTLFD